MRSIQVLSEPLNDASNPKFIPGAEALYALNVAIAGTGGVNNNSPAVVDPIPANTRLITSNLSGGAPIVFLDGVPSGDLPCAVIALNNVTDRVDFSNDRGVTWTYVPNGSLDHTATHIHLIPAEAVSGDAVAGSPSPSFNLQFRLRVQ